MIISVSFLMLVICVFFFSLGHMVKGLTILLIFSKNQALVLFIFLHLLFFILTWGHFSLLLERKGERETLMRERSISWLPPKCTCTRGDPMHPDGGSNLQPRYLSWLGIKPQPFGYQMVFQPAEPHCPGLNDFLNLFFNYSWHTILYISFRHTT